MPEDIATNLINKGIVPFSGMSDAITAMATTAQMTPKNASPLLLPPAPSTGRILSEAEAKAALSQKGARIPKASRAVGATAAAKAAAQIGFPVVLKGEGIAHKTEAGAVVLALQNAGAVQTAAQTMPTDKFLVEEMIIDTVAELLIGVVADPAHGYVLTLAAGGTLTELMTDSVSLLVPSTPEHVRTALEDLRITVILNGYRGKPAAEIDAIVAAVMAVQDYVVATRPQEIEINPLMCGPHAAIIADALIRIGDET